MVDTHLQGKIKSPPVMNNYVLVFLCNKYFGVLDFVLRADVILLDGHQDLERTGLN